MSASSFAEVSEEATKKVAEEKNPAGTKQGTDGKLQDLANRTT